MARPSPFLISMRRFASILAASGAVACASADESRVPFDAGTDDDRAALFDYILEKTKQREAFSPVKNVRLNLDLEGAMGRFRNELVAADTEEKLYYALAKISNARKDRHLRIGLVEGGLRLGDTTGADQSNYPVPGGNVLHAPVRFAVDYGTADGYFLFVADYAENLSEITPGAPQPNVGDRLVAVNGRSFSEYREAVEPYHRYSTINGFWWQLATWLPQNSVQFPPSMYDAQLSLELERHTGDRYTLRLPYLAPEEILWERHGDRAYPGFHTVMDTESFSLHRPDTDRSILILTWNGFQDQLKQDMDRLMEYAERSDILDHALIVDATRSRGGSNGAYAVRRFSPTPFRTTFGDLRISDASMTFVSNRIERLAARERFPAVLGDGDDGGWLLSWIEDDFMPAAERRGEYTEPVPFKLAHLPKDSDGIVHPADVHFRGPLVVWLGPYGGSHLDQFASIVVDNDLGHTMGMPAGGYSNTWEWEEVLRLPGPDQPVVSFMWTIGHTFRPNGEILEGNPAEVDEYVPLTRENYGHYHAALLERSLAHLRIR